MKSLRFAALLLLAGCSATGADAQSLSRNQVRAELENVLETLSGRELTAQELDSVTAEYIPLFGESGCGVSCVENVHWNAERITRIKRSGEGPEAARLRHEYVSSTYFSPVQGGSLIQRIIAEPDSVVLYDSANQRLMTRSDVIAALSLGAFAQSDGPPVARSVTDEELIEASVALKEAIVAVHGGVMPFRLTLANTLWTGIVASWPDFSEEQRAQARAYFQGDDNGPELTLPVFAAMYGASPDEAQAVFSEDKFQEELARIRQLAYDYALHSAKMTQIRLWWGVPR